jgi:adenylylsulfate kinase
MRETHFRSVLKGITWRVIASTTTMTVVYFVTGDLTLVASVGIVDITAKVFFYYLHERTWGKVRWGVLGVEPNIK